MSLLVIGMAMQGKCLERDDGKLKVRILMYGPLFEPEDGSKAAAEEDSFHAGKSNNTLREGGVIPDYKIIFKHLFRNYEDSGEISSISLKKIAVLLLKYSHINLVLNQ